VSGKFLAPTPHVSTHSSPRKAGAKGSVTYIHETETRHDILALNRPTRGKSARGTAGIDEELVHVLEALEPVGAAPAEHVDVQLVRLGQQQVRLVADQGEALEEADADAAVRDDLRQGEGGGLDVVAALDDLEVGRYRAEVLVCALVGQVAEAEGLAYLSGGEELLELYVAFVLDSCLRP